MNIIAGYLSLIFYTISFFLLLRYTKLKKGHRTRSYMLTSWLVAAILHTFYLYLPLFYNSSHFVLSVSYASSYIMSISSTLLLITLLNHRVEILGLFIIPATIFFTLSSLFYSDPPSGIHLMGQLGIHILSSLLGYSLLALATAQAILLYFQNKQLHHHTFSSFLSRLPPLEDMERLLFHFLIAGVFFLSVSIISGFFGLTNIMEQKVSHKTVLSIIAFIIYSTLLLGHSLFGWRGKKAIRFTIIAFILLLIGFMGSKIVYEFII